MQQANQNSPHPITELMRENIKHLRPYLLDTVTDLHINQPGEIFVKHANGNRERILDPKLSHEFLTGMCKLMANISGQEFDEYANPLIGFKLPGGHRAQVVAGTYVESGLALAIRVNSGRQFSIANFGLSEKEQERVTKAVQDCQTILISGGTGCGKTSFINSLIPFIPQQERIVTIEDVNELIVPHLNHTPLIYTENHSRNPIDSQALFNAALRLDPDRIIIGEIRQKNAITFFNAINSGHSGSLATIHANNPTDAINKICDYMVLDGKISAESTGTAISRLRNWIALVIQLKFNNNERTAELLFTV